MNMQPVLKDEYISEKDYLHANNVSNMFKNSTISKYHDLYFKADVLLLADVFKNFIGIFLGCYGLNTCNCFNSPALSWAAMSKMTKIKLELISHIDMHLFIEKRLRGGIYYIAKGDTKANSQYMQS